MTSDWLGRGETFYHYEEWDVRGLSGAGRQRFVPRPFLSSLSLGYPYAELAEERHWPSRETYRPAAETRANDLRKTSDAGFQQ